MKRKIKVIDNIMDKVIEGEQEFRNLDHFEVQLKYRAHVYKNKKGKGSYKRNKKIEEEK